MNILHHKSWHVRNRNNIERVRRDEQNARNEELEREKRIALADSEARVGLLRQRLPQRAEKTATVVATVSNTDGRHLDLFEDFGDKMQTTNREHEREAIEEKEKFEKKTGILQYLVDKDVDSEHNWYLDSHEKRMKLTDSTTVAIDSEKELKDNKWKKMNDPIEDMKKYLNSMKSTEEKAIEAKRSLKSIKFVKSSESSHKMKSKKSKKHKKHKKKKRKRVSDQSSDTDSDDKQVLKKKVSKNLEQLRAERLERERVEKERTRALLTGRPQTTGPVVEMDDRLRTYNSQFNPEIARQNQNYDK